jgi:hypothetical protein
VVGAAAVVAAQAARITVLDVFGVQTEAAGDKNHPSATKTHLMQNQKARRVPARLARSSISGSRSRHANSLQFETNPTALIS